MTFFTQTAAAGIALAIAPAVSAAPVGVEFDRIFMPHHDRTTKAGVFYPSQGDGREITMAENPVFQGVKVQVGADMAEGRHPVILLSHGMSGAFQSTAWLAKGLAERGVIVVSVNHPNTTWSDFNIAKGLRHWSRAEDMQAALDRLMAYPAYARHIDHSRIMAAGFSYGGWTALSLAGMRGNRDGAVESCREMGDSISYCGVILSEAFGLPTLEATDWNSDYADARITHAVALDPGFVWGLSHADTSDLIDNVAMIGLGQGADRMPGTDFDKSGLSALIPEVETTQMPGHHFTAMPLCKPAGAAILAEENDDPVCTDPEGVNRAEVHDALIKAIAARIGL